MPALSLPLFGPSKRVRTYHSCVDPPLSISDDPADAITAGPFRGLDVAW